MERESSEPEDPQPEDILKIPDLNKELCQRGKGEVGKGGGGFFEREEGMNTLSERRAEFVYNAARLAANTANAPIIPALWDDREQDFKDQFIKVIDRQCGDQRSSSPEELHGSWMQAYFLMGWVFGEKYDRENRTHPDLLPYAQLGQLERDKDAVFVALCEIARQWIY